MLNKMFLLIAACCLILSSCGVSGSSAGNASSNAGQNQHAETNTGANDGAPNGGSNSNAEEDANQQLSEPGYHFDQAYRVIPNNEGADKKVVLLTFDDGPKEKEVLEQLLDTLDKHEAKAIFFVNGYHVQSNPDLLRLIHDRGQLIGNHSWDHIDLKQEPADSARKQVEDVQKIVEETIGERPQFFRPPFGSSNETLHRITEDNDLTYITWSNDSMDWDPKFNNPESVVNNIMDQLHPGSNILMHELPWTAEALDELLTKIKSEGYGFVDPRMISHPAES